MSVLQAIKKYTYLYNCHKVRNPKIVMAYIKRIDRLKKEDRA